MSLREYRRERRELRRECYEEKRKREEKRREEKRRGEERRGEERREEKRREEKRVVKRERERERERRERERRRERKIRSVVHRESRIREAFGLAPRGGQLGGASGTAALLMVFSSGMIGK